MCLCIFPPPDPLSLLFQPKLILNKSDNGKGFHSLVQLNILAENNVKSLFRVGCYKLEISNAVS